MNRNGLKRVFVTVVTVLALTGCGQPRGTSDASKDRETKMAMPDSSMKGMRGMAGSGSAREVWTCPMHPEVIKDKPGTCPICGMDLVKKETEAPKIKVVGLEDLLRPTNEFVVSSVPVTGIREETLQPELVVFGTVGYDTRRQNTIAARVSGRIEKLYVRYRYQQVGQGQRIMDLYSPELATGEQDYLYLLKNDPGNTAMIGAARQRLLLLGVSEKRLEEVARTGKASATIDVFSPYAGHIHEAGNTMPGGSLSVAAGSGTGMPEELQIKEGMYVEKGQTVFQVFDMNRSWMLLSLYPDQGALVRKGDRVEIVPETAPDKAFAAQIDLVEPYYRQGYQSQTLRVYFDNSRRDIPVGSPVKATIQPKSVMGNWLSKESVLSLGTDKIVFLREDGGFRVHKVITGILIKDKVQVLSGLTDKDSVAANAQFLMDSENFLKAASRQ